MSNKLKFKLIIIFLAPVTMVINIVLKRYPGFVEKYYSTTINKLIRQTLSFITGFMENSFAEFLVPLLLIILVLSILFLFLSVKRKRFVQDSLSILAYASSLYVLFMLLWGFNYNRFSFDRIAGLEVKKSSKQELYELCSSLIERANVLREKVAEDNKGVMSVPGGYKDVFQRVQKGYDEASKKYPELGGRYGRPKRILISEKMSYTGITGIYIPYTGEANVNINMTDFSLPSTTAHEMAHQRGFAREDEANYIAYLTCSMHPDADFQYSGVMLGVIYSMNALADSDLELYRQLVKKYSEGVRKDLINDMEFWDKYKGKVEEVSNNVNNTYLKSNGQQDGVESYGRMVDLLLAEHRNGKQS